MTTGRGTKNNILAGAFVLTSIALAVGIIIVLADLRTKLTPTTSYIVRFPLEIGAEGLTTDSPVKTGGIPVGRVVALDFVEEAAGTGPTAVDVRIRVRRSVTLFEDANVVLVLPLLGTTAAINISSVGTGQGIADPQGGDPRLSANERLPGKLAPPLFLTQAGYGRQQAEQVQTILRNVSDMSDRLNRVSARIEDELTPRIDTMSKSLDEASAAITDVRTLTADARAAWPAWKERVDTMMANSASLTERFAEIGDLAVAGTKDARRIITDIQARVEANRESFDRIVANMRDITDRIRNESMDQVHGALRAGETALNQFADAGEQVNSMLIENRASINETVASARLAAQELKLTAVEVRHAPWKLLAKPTGRKELETEVLYDSVREYALAVSDLKTAAATLQALQENNARPAEISAMIASMQDAFKRYEAAERTFLSKWIGGKP